MAQKKRISSLVIQLSACKLWVENKRVLIILLNNRIQYVKTLSMEQMLITAIAQDLVLFVIQLKQ